MSEEFEDTKEVTRNRKLKKDRQHNGQKKKYKGTNNDLQNITHKTKDPVTSTPVKTGSELMCSTKIEQDNAYLIVKFSITPGCFSSSVWNSSKLICPLLFVSVASNNTSVKFSRSSSLS